MRGVALLVLVVALEGAAAAPTRAAKAEGRCRFRECVRTRGSIEAVGFPPAPPFPTPLAGAFYFAPPGGWGMGASDCTGQVVVDVNQNVVKYARSAGTSGDGGVAVVTCIKADAGTGVELAASEPVVASFPTSLGTRGVLNEAGGTNFLNATWDLGASTWTATATVTRDAWSGPFTHYGATRGFEAIDDTSGAASQSVCQTLATTTQTTYAFSCWLRAGTLNTARMSITGAGNAAGDRTCAISGLDTALSWDDRKGCVTAAGYGAGITAVTVCVLPGAVNGDQGTIGVVDCQLEKNDHVTSYIPNGWPAGTSTRLISGTSIPTAPATLTLSDTRGCAGGDYYVRRYDAEAWWSFISFARTGRGPYSGTATSMSTFDGTNVVTVATSSLWNATASGVVVWAPDGGLTIATGASSNTGSYDGTMFGTTISADSFGIASSAGSQDALVGNVRVALSDTACDAGTMSNITRVGWLGDSISARTDPDPKNPPAGFFERESVNGTNFSVVGAQFSTGASNCVSQWALGGNGTYDTIVLWCGVNDILVGTLGASLFATELAWVREWAYRGVQVYWADIAPFAGYDSNASKLAERNAFNALHVTYCSAPEPGVHCIRIAPVLEEPGNTNYLYPPYSHDGIHLTQDGANVSAATFGAQYP